MNYDEMLTIDEAADVLKVSVRTIYRLRETGVLACTRFGRSVRFTWEQLNDAVKYGGPKPGTPPSKPRPPKDPEQARTLRELRERHGMNF